MHQYFLSLKGKTENKWLFSFKISIHWIFNFSFKKKIHLETVEVGNWISSANSIPKCYKLVDLWILPRFSSLNVHSYSHSRCGWCCSLCIYERRGSCLLLNKDILDGESLSTMKIIWYKWWRVYKSWLEGR